MNLRIAKKIFLGGRSLIYRWNRGPRQAGAGHWIRRTISQRLSNRLVRRLNRQGEFLRHKRGIAND